MTFGIVFWGSFSRCQRILVIKEREKLELLLEIRVGTLVVTYSKIINFIP
jgi:hypothetical protein